jgi:hypothetical protein
VPAGRQGVAAEQRHTAGRHPVTEGVGQVRHHVGGLADRVRHHLALAELGHVDDRRRRSVDRNDGGRMAARSPAPRLVEHDGVVRVEAGQVEDVGVVVLGRAAARPRQDAGVAALVSELTGAPLALAVLGRLDRARRLCAGLYAGPEAVKMPA